MSSFGRRQQHLDMSETSDKSFHRVSRLVGVPTGPKTIVRLPAVIDIGLTHS